jgi:hypothetical protein
VHAKPNTKMLQIRIMERQRKSGAARSSLRNGADTFGGMAHGLVVRRNIDGVALVASGFTFHDVSIV